MVRLIIHTRLIMSFLVVIDAVGVRAVTLTLVGIMFRISPIRANSHGMNLPCILCSENSDGHQY